MANVISNTFKTLYVMFFLINLYIIFSACEFISIEALFQLRFLEVIRDLDRIFDLFSLIIAAFSQIAISLSSLVAYGGSIFLGGGAAGIAATNFPSLISAIFPTETTNLPIESIFENLVLSLGVLITVILIPMIVLTAIGFLIRGETRLSMYSFLGFILLLTLAMYTDNMSMDLSIPESGNIFSFLTAPIFSVALLLYLMLEFSFQVSYTLNIMEPMQERERRIKKHLQRVRSFVPKASATIEAQEAARVSQQQQKRFGVLAASYLRELVEKKVFKKGEDRLSDKAMMRLQSYIDSLSKLDSDFEEKVTARSAQPEANKILKELVPTMAIRFVFIVFISVFILDPLPLMQFLQNLGLIYFPQLLDSLEISQPEFSTLVVFNVVLVIILLGSLFSYLNKRIPEMEPETQKVDTLIDFSAEGLSAGYSSDSQDYDEADNAYE